MLEREAMAVLVSANQVSYGQREAAIRRAGSALEVVRDPYAYALILGEAGAASVERSAKGADAMLEKLEDLPMTKSRPLLRYLSSNAADVQADAQGRILLPKHLLEYAGLVKEAVIIGAGANRAEIWSPERYEEVVGAMTQSDIFEDFAALGL